MLPNFKSDIVTYTIRRMDWKLLGRAIRGRRFRIWSPFSEFNFVSKWQQKNMCLFDISDETLYIKIETHFSRPVFDAEHDYEVQNTLFKVSHPYSWRRKGSGFGLGFQHNASLSVKAKRHFWWFRFRFRVFTNAFLSVKAKRHVW